MKEAGRQRKQEKIEVAEKRGSKSQEKRKLTT